MKKSLYGYDIKQTEEQIDSLQNQNDLLTTKITNLTMKLNSATEGLNGLETAQETIQENEVLKEKVAQLEKENHTLRAELEAQIKMLKKENQELKEQLDNKAPEKVSHIETDALLGSICESAYQDMAKLKAQTADEMLNHVDTYSKIVDESNAKMQNALSDVTRLYHEALEHITDAVRDMYQHLETVEQSNQVIEKQLQSTTNISEQLKNNIVSFVNKSVYPKKQMQEETVETEQEPDSLHDLLQKISKKVNVKAASPAAYKIKEQTNIVEEKISNEVENSKKNVIQISANVKTSDVLEA